jgi:hypothetical protein
MRAPQFHDTRARFDARKMRQQHSVDAHARSATFRRLMKFYLAV